MMPRRSSAAALLVALIPAVAMGLSFREETDVAALAGDEWRALQTSMMTQEGGSFSFDFDDDVLGPFIDPDGEPVCSDGTPGIQAKNACCVKYCGRCGGVGCSQFGVELGFDMYDCCETEILDFGTPCSETGFQAPCIVGDEMAPEMTPSPTAMMTAAPAVEEEEVEEEGGEGLVCGDGIAGVVDATAQVCCPTGCSVCGGPECGTASLPEYGAADCCVPDIFASELMCSVTEVAPCMTFTVCTDCDDNVDSEFEFPIPGGDDEMAPGMTAAPTDLSSDFDVVFCSNGIAGVEDATAQVCCPTGCAMCGGPECGTASLPDFGPADCCVPGIFASEMMCSVTQVAPCMTFTGCTDCDDNVNSGFEFPVPGQ